MKTAVSATSTVYRWLELDRAVSSMVRVRVWKRDRPEPLAAKPNAHPGVEVAWVESGALRYHVHGRDILVSAGSTVVIPCQAEHATTFLAPMRGVALWIHPDFVAQMASAMTSRSRADRGFALAPGVISTASRSIPRLLRVLEEEVREEGDGHVLATESITEAILVEMLRTAPSTRTPVRDPRILAAIEEMRARSSEPVVLDALARTVGLSRFHFSRLFRAEVGESPYQHVTRIRIARAVELLRGGHHTVTEAAIDAGFRDLSRFSRTFRKYTGMRPSEMLGRARSA